VQRRTQPRSKEEMILQTEHRGDGKLKEEKSVLKKGKGARKRGVFVFERKVGVGAGAKVGHRLLTLIVKNRSVGAVCIKVLVLPTGWRKQGELTPKNDAREGLVTCLK